MKYSKEELELKFGGHWVISYCAASDSDEAVCQLNYNERIVYRHEIFTLQHYGAGWRFVDHLKDDKAVKTLMKTHFKLSNFK